MRRIQIVLGCFFLSLYGYGCATPEPAIKSMTHEELVIQDQAIGKELAERFETKLNFKQDPESVYYLTNLSQQLLNHSPGLLGKVGGVWLIHKRPTVWRSFALPGNRIYVPLELIKALEFETEVAALLAIQLGHILRQNLLTHLKAEFLPIDSKNDSEALSLNKLLIELNHKNRENLDLFDPKGVFKFSVDEEAAAVRSAVGILYRAGFDARGIISLFSLYRRNPRYSPFKNEDLEQLIEVTHHEIATFAPLRNPVVRSQDFLRIQKRMRQL